MTGLNAVAQWLLGGGGDVLRFCLYLCVAWLLLGALPRMRRDAARKVPQVRGMARDRMKQYAVPGRRKSAEWWGWTAAWGTVAALAEGARFGGYVVRSAWHGWGDHRRRAVMLRTWRPRKHGAAATSGEGDAPETTPPGGGGNGPGGGGLPPQDDPDHPGPRAPETVPPRQSGPDHPAGPPQPEDLPSEPPQPSAIPEPAHSGAGGNGVPNVVPLFPPQPSPAGQENRGEAMPDAEISNLEAALRVVSQMQAESRQALEAAQLEKARTEKALKDTEQAAQALAAAGVSGPVMEAFVRYHEAMEVAERAAASEVTAYEMAVAAADSARGALAAHQDAADQLRATQGAADSTKWYVAG